jgi:hypothetical protein
MATHVRPGGSAFADGEEKATKEVAMLSSNKTHKTPAAQTAANVALGQFLKVCRSIFSVRLTERLILRLTSLLAPLSASAFVVVVGIPLDELFNTGLSKCW